VVTRPTLSSYLTTPASSKYSVPTITFSKRCFGKLPRTWTIASGENFDAHPAQAANSVSLIFLAVILSSLNPIPF